MQENKLMRAAILLCPEAYVDYRWESDDSISWWVNSGPGELVDCVYPTLESALKVFVSAQSKALRVSVTEQGEILTQIAEILKDAD